jgi:hypothetical protein
MRPRKRTARHALLIGLVVYVALQTGFALLLAFGPPYWRSPNYGYKLRALKTRLAASTRRPLTVVMFGTSRTLQGLRGDLAEGPLTSALGRPVIVHNFAFTGAGPFTTLLNLRRLLDDGIRPDLVLIELLPALLADRDYLRDNTETIHPVPSLRVGELDLVRRYAGSSRELHDHDWWLNWAYPAYAHRLTFVTHTTPILLSYAHRMDGYRDADPFGWIPPQAQFRTSEKRAAALAHARKEYFDELAHFELAPLPTRAVREALELCRQAGIAAAVVLMPEGPVFRSWYPPATRKQIDTFLADLKRRYDTPVIDASAWLDSEDYFLDSHHLLPEPAAVFSRRLGHEALPPLLRQYSEGGSAPNRGSVQAQNAAGKHR